MARPPSSTEKRASTARAAAENTTSAATTTAEPALSFDTKLLEQVKRLVVAAELQTNMLARLVALHEAGGRQASKARAARTRRTAEVRPIEITPMVAAAVRRTLRRVQQSPSRGS